MTKSLLGVMMVNIVNAIEFLLFFSISSLRKIHRNNLYLLICLELKMNELISIIIPVYNIKSEYLIECLDSVINQTYINLEIFLIDDGSTDNSGKVCDEYAQKDQRIKVIHKSNGGVSSARNAGLDLANGEYITFIDSDDFVSDKYIEKLYENIKENKSDIVFCRFSKYVYGKVEYITEVFPELLSVDIKEEVFSNFFYSFLNYRSKIYGSVWRVLYKRELIKKIRFNLNISICEDVVFLLQAIIKAERLTSIDDYLYFYRQIDGTAVSLYKKNYLQGQLVFYHEIEKIFSLFDDKRSIKVLHICSALMCYYVFTNELKFKNNDRKLNIQNIRESELYSYFKLKNGLRTYGMNKKIKFFIVWFLVKMRLI